MTDRHPVRAMVALLLGLVVLVSLLSFRPGDWSGWGWDEQLLDAQNAFGFLGAIVAKLLIFLLGALAIWLLSPFFLIAAITDLLGRSRRKPLMAWAGAALLILLWGGSDMMGGPLEARQGWLGTLLSEGLSSLTGAMGSQIILAFLSLIGLLLLLPGRFLEAVRHGLGRVLGGIIAVSAWILTGIGEAATIGGRALISGLSWIGTGIATLSERSIGAMREAFSGSRSGPAIAAEPTAAKRSREAEILDTIEEVEDIEPVARAARAAGGGAAVTGASGGGKTKRKTASRKQGKFILPDPTLLADPGQGGGPEDQRFVEERAQILVDKLASFNIGGRVSAMSQGPVVTTYEFEPDTGVKVSQIISRREDLALALRSKELRMVAPIPGKAAVGVELPNPKPRVIRLREVLEARDARGTGGDLAVALGVDVDGIATWTDLAEMPHLLVAGATGTGKSVCINVILVSLLLAHTPETLKLFLVDPKMLELSIYNEIPHLMHPVITDNRVALQALNWLVSEMERRYLLLKPAGVRSIDEYNTKVKAGEVNGPDGERITETLPFLVGVVEEFADLIMTMGKDIHTPIVRLAQMARAVGIHLILATQRPSVDIIDGVIKANFPSRIAFKVFSRFDSKTILDGNGAETLIGRGDMLFKHGRQPFPQRLHGAFIETDEVERVVGHWREYANGKEHVDLAPRKGGARDYMGEDELFDDCKRIVVMQGFGSTTMLQRRLRIGYTRASRLMDMLEDGGIVGPHTGSKAREVLVGPEVLEGNGEDEAPI